MRQRISARVDYNILADIALGFLQKIAATRYGLYLKIKTGRKKD